MVQARGYSLDPFEASGTSIALIAGFFWGGGKLSGPQLLGAADGGGQVSQLSVRTLPKYLRLAHQSK